MTRFTFKRPSKHWRRLNTKRHRLIDKKFSVTEGIEGVGLSWREELRLAATTRRMDRLMSAERDRIYGPEVAAAVRGDL